MKSSQKVFYFRLFLGILWASVAVVGIFFLAKNGISGAHFLMRDFLAIHEDTKIALFLALFAVRVFFFVPAIPFFFVAVALFSPITAFFLAIIGEMLSLVILYFLIGFVGKSFFQKHENRFFQKIDALLERRGFFATMIFVIIPFIPNDSVAAIAGISRISFADFFYGALVGVALTTPAYLFLGNIFENPKNILFAIGGFLIIFAITAWAWQHPHFRHFFPWKK